MNLKALRNHGSLEFRSLRGSASQEEITQWASLLVHLREMAKTYISPVDILNQFSIMGALPFVRNLLGNYYTMVYGYPNLEETLTESMWRLQGVAFKGHWREKIEPPEETTAKRPTKPELGPIHAADAYLNRERMMRAERLPNGMSFVQWMDAQRNMRDEALQNSTPVSTPSTIVWDDEVEEEF
jgi:hypothetical protein